MKAAFGYIRAVRGDGLSQQSETLLHFSKDYRIKLLRLYRESTVTGSADSLAAHTAFTEMLSALCADSDGVKTLIVARLAVLAGDYIQQEAILCGLRSQGVDVISCLESPDVLKHDPRRALVRKIRDALVEYERIAVVARLRGARMKAKATTGSAVEGRKAYGHFEGEEAILTEMKRLRASGASYGRIASTLNERGIKPRSGEKWYAGVVYRLLRS